MRDDDDIEIVDLDAPDDVARSGSGAFSRRSRLWLGVLTAIGAVVALVLFWPAVASLVAITRATPPAATPAPRPTVVAQTPPRVSMLTIGDVRLVKESPSYTGDNGFLYALQTTTGHSLWQVSQPVRDFGVVAGDNVYIYTSTYSLAILNAHSGHLLWQRQLGNEATVVGTLAQQVYVSDGEQLTAYDVNTGKQLWSRTRVGSFLQVDAGLIYTFANSHLGWNLLALRPQDGQTVANYTMLDVYLRSIQIENGLAYVVQANSIMFTLQLSDHRQLWRQTLPPNANVARIVDGRIYLDIYDQGKDNQIEVLRGRDGAFLWHYSYGYVSTTDIQDGIVYVSAHSSISALRVETGQLLWHYETGYLDPDIRINAGTVYVNSFSAGVVDTLNAHTGKPIWHYATSQRGKDQSSIISFIVHIDGGIVYIASVNDLTLNAISASNKSPLWNTLIHISR
ncbi:hypothetical protein KDA_27750 [Dictyobacter alpinus]|uniref:Pyrrolo-quinoline quinone repeat domain-containing protein n=1 Tax=Dictyobacter alpinus TaxID=2014873 RepID=A0A402B7E1_9CHLR|nr:PQQ-binding-like beta-propeller repeat protein [Dictyobacter alpinus]GCE27291.1 hypothetical protein KDA_27750 [Dictyobacter alpinus]